MNYTVNEECDFCAWIATNGETDRNGKMFPQDLINENGRPTIRNCIQRIDFLREYSYQWNNRYLPEGWDESHRKMVKDYISDVAIPSIELMRSLMMGEVI